MLIWKQVAENDSDGDLPGGAGRRGGRVTFVQQDLSRSVTDYYDAGKLSERLEIR